MHCPLWVHINHAGLVQWIDSNWAQRKLAICRKNLKCRYCPSGNVIMYFPCFGTFILKISEASHLLSVFFPPLQKDCWIHLFRSFRSSSNKAAVVFLCFPELSITSDESWCVIDLTNGWVLWQKKWQSQLQASSQLNPSPPQLPDLFSCCLRETLNPH